VPKSRDHWDAEGNLPRPKVCLIIYSPQYEALSYSQLIILIRISHEHHSLELVWNRR